MRPLVLFLIGGSGARFLRSLLYQLAAGLELHNITVIKLVIIDTDEANGNYEQALNLLGQYQQIRERVEQDSSNFRDKDGSKLFFHEVQLFDDNRKFITPLNASQRSLRSIVDYTNLDHDQADFVNLMLTNEELNEDLSIGFQGRPNMGTIGLEAIDKCIEASGRLNNLLGDSPDLKSEGVSGAVFFTVSSMFGGMGASGMPLLINKFSRSAYNDVPLASLCFMPYFKIKEGKGNNNSRYFPQRTVLAFDHYKRDFTSKLDNLYFIGKSFDDENGVSYAPGSKKQANEAHYVEFLSVTSLIHFCRHTPAKRRNMHSYALHVDEYEGDGLYANCAGPEYVNSYEKYIRFVFMARYFIDRFEQNYSSEEMKNINWVQYAGFADFTNEDKLLLHQFFTELLAYDWDELYTYSGFRVLQSKGFPANIESAVPHKLYSPYRPKFSFTVRRYNTYQELDMYGLTDKGISSRENIPRLLSIFDRSFTTIFNNIYK
ncbi:hypothetical protein [Niastella sp. OAS944]|uniref:hypothetical protein n=1 Tax=Niastella sp. OAS944 TaxID=2664089 RepID=UPI00346AACDE|nr:hypothetical protein [Chitinophagaceae bacterium OAS944]